MTSPALLRRFGTKAELMLKALLPPGVPDWIVLAEQGPVAGQDGRAQLRALLGELDAFLRVFAPCFATLKASDIDMRRLISHYDVPPPVRGQRALAGWLSRAVALDLVRPVQCADVAIALMGALQGRAMLEHLFGIRSEEQYVDTLFDVMWTGLAPEEAA